MALKSFRAKVHVHMPCHANLILLHEFLSLITFRRSKISLKSDYIVTASATFIKDISDAMMLVINTFLNVTEFVVSQAN